MAHVFRRSAAFVVAALVLALTATVASADGPGWKTIAQFPGPAFGVNAGQGDNLLVAGPEGPVKLDPDDGDQQLIASIPGVADVIQTGRREYYVIVGGEDRGPDDGPCPAASLCRIKNGNVTQVADVLEFELDNDPDGSGNAPGEDSITNLFDLVKFGNKFLVADAGGNSILKISKNGRIDWVATLPQEILPTQPLKDLAGCPNPPPDLAFICGLDAEIPADAVATTVTVGKNGKIYAGELKGFPANPGTSRVWAIDRDARHAQCGSDPDDCTQVNTPPFTSIIEMEAHGKTIYVLEVDEASWLAAEGGQGVGGTVNACRASNGRGNGDNDRRRSDDDDDDDDDDNGNGNGITWTCEEIATGLPFPTALTKQDGSIYVTLLNFFQGPFEVVELTNGNGNGGDDDDDD
jgi:hypothetical protein